MFRRKPSDCLIILSKVMRLVDLQKKTDEIRPSRMKRKKKNSLVEQSINMEIMKNISDQLKEEEKLYNEIKKLIDKADARHVNEWNGNEASQGFDNRPLLMHLIEVPMLFSYLLNKPGISIKVKDSRRNSLLHLCVSHSDSLSYLISKINEEKDTKDHKILNELNKLNNDGKSPLRICLENNLLDAASHILQFSEISDHMNTEIEFIRKECEEIAKEQEVRPDTKLGEILKKKTEMYNIMVNKIKAKVLQAKSNYQSALSAYNERPSNTVLKLKCEKMEKIYDEILELSGLRQVFEEKTSDNIIQQDKSDQSNIINIPSLVVSQNIDTIGENASNGIVSSSILTVNNVTVIPISLPQQDNPENMVKDVDSEIADAKKMISEIESLIDKNQVAINKLENEERKREREIKLEAEEKYKIMKEFTSNGKTELPLDIGLSKLMAVIQAAIANPEEVTSISFQSSVHFDTDETKDILSELAKLLRNEKSCLAELNLSNTKIGDSEVKIITDSIIANKKSKLSRLELNKNTISASGGEHLSDLLKNSTSLKYLLLAENALGNEGLIKIAAGIRQNTTLLELNISKNQIESDTGIQELTKSVISNPNSNFNLINFSGNPLGESGVAAIGKLLPALLKISFKRYIGGESYRPVVFYSFENTGLNDIGLCQFIHAFKENISMATVASSEMKDHLNRHRAYKLIDLWKPNEMYWKFLMSIQTRASISGNYEILINLMRAKLQRLCDVLMKLHDIRFFYNISDNLYNKSDLIITIANKFANEINQCKKENKDLNNLYKESYLSIEETLTSLNDHIENYISQAEKAIEKQSIIPFQLYLDLSCNKKLLCNDETNASLDAFGHLFSAVDGINLSYTDIGDAQFRNLSPLLSSTKELNWLSIDSTKVTINGLNDLLSKIPDLNHIRNFSAHGLSSPANGEDLKIFFGHFKKIKINLFCASFSDKPHSNELEEKSEWQNELVQFLNNNQKSLQKLNFGSELLTDDTISRLPLNTLVNLRRLWLHGSQIGNNGISYIIRSQMTNKLLESLILANNENSEINVEQVSTCFLDDDGKRVTHLIDAYVNGQKSLVHENNNGDLVKRTKKSSLEIGLNQILCGWIDEQSVIINDNSLSTRELNYGDAIIDYVIAALQRNPAISSIKISQNGITTVGLRKLINYLIYHHGADNLTKLIIKDKLSDDNVNVDVAELIAKSPNLTRLEINGLSGLRAQTIAPSISHGNNPHLLLPSTSRSAQAIEEGELKSTANNSMKLN